MSARVKEARAAAAAEAAAEMHREYLAGCVGSGIRVLFEQEKNGKFVGHAPNYMEVYSKGSDLHNKVRMVRITGVEGDGLAGEIEE